METRKKFIILLVLLLVVGAGVFMYLKNKSQISNQSEFSSTQITSSTVPIIDKAKEQEFEEAIQKISSLDQDMDGIADIEEARYKTDSNSADTDGDGLTDWQEVFIFSTDPLKADTDSDTFADGYEVRHGFSPKGTGRL